MEVLDLIRVRGEHLPRDTIRAIIICLHNSFCKTFFGFKKLSLSVFENRQKDLHFIRCMMN